jgi:hypothetical protein
MTEAEELELLELEAEEAGAPTPTKGGQGGAFGRGLEFVSRQLNRVPAAMRGAAEAVRRGGPKAAASLANPVAALANPAVRDAIPAAFAGFINPDDAPTSQQLAANFGASTEQNIPQFPAQSPYGGMALAHLPPELQASQYQPTGHTSQADLIGGAMDLALPTGLEILPPLKAAALARGGRAVQRSGTQAIQSSLKPSAALRRGPVPYDSEHLLTPRAGFPDGLGSAMGKERTLENIETFHNTLGDAQDAILQQIPQVDILQSVADAATDVERAISQGGNARLGLSARDANALRAEIQHWTDAAERISPTGATTGANARQFRGSLGTEARYDGSLESTNARRVVAATIRERLNEQFTALSPQFRDLDAQFAETIPLRNAVAEALGKEANRYPIGLRTGMVLATGGASIPAELAKVALIEGTSRFAPQMAAAKAGRAIAGAANAGQNAMYASIPALMAARAAGMPPEDENIPPYLRGR